MRQAVITPPCISTGWTNTASLILTVTSGGNTVQVVEYTPPTDPLVITLGSLSPADVIQSEPVSFTVQVTNPNAMDITLDSSSNLSFTTGSMTYAAALLDTPVLRTGIATTVIFHLETVNTATLLGTYDVQLAWHGTDTGGQSFGGSATLSSSVMMHENMPLLTEVPGSFPPVQPTRESLIVCWIEWSVLCLLNACSA